MTDMMNFPDLTRNIAIVGHLHHGKTSFVDMLVSETHNIPVNVDQPVMHILILWEGIKTDIHLIQRSDTRTHIRLNVNVVSVSRACP